VRPSVPTSATAEPGREHRRQRAMRFPPGYSVETREESPLPGPLACRVEPARRMIRILQTAMATRSYPPDPDIVSSIFSLELAREWNNGIPINSGCNRTMSLGTHPNLVFRALAQGKGKAHEIRVSQEFDGSLCTSD